MAVQETSLKPEVARAMLKVFDNKDGEAMISFLESNIKARFPDYNNVNNHMALSGQLQFIEAIRVFVRIAKRQVEKERQEHNGNGNE
jgi:exopolysaccharide biosynthesis predicted pyruvyltransferase EpsI